MNEIVYCELIDLNVQGNITLIILHCHTIKYFVAIPTHRFMLHILISVVGFLFSVSLAHI